MADPASSPGQPRATRADAGDWHAAERLVDVLTDQVQGEEAEWLHRFGLNPMGQLPKSDAWHLSSTFTWNGMPLRRVTMVRECASLESATAAVVQVVDAVPKICPGNVRPTDEYVTYLTYVSGSD